MNNIKLSKQEEGITNLLCEYGYTDKELAEILGIGVTAVRAYISNISRKIEEATGFKNVNRVKIVLYFLGILKQPATDLYHDIGLSETAHSGPVPTAVPVEPHNLDDWRINNG